MMKHKTELAYEVFRHHMIEIRKKAGMTQAHLANLLGKPQSFVAKYENGERRLDVIEFLSIAEVLNVDSYDVIRSLSAKIKEEERSKRK